MTMTDARDHSKDVTVIPGYAENPSPGAAAADHLSRGGDTPLPPENAGGDIASVGTRDRSEKTPCPECGKPILSKNLSQHRRNIHGVYKTERGGKKGKHAKPVEAQGKDKSEKTEKPPTVDEIVAVVVQMRWPSRMPSNKVMALLEWRAATERFLSE